MKFPNYTISGLRKILHDQYKALAMDGEVDMAYIQSIKDEIADRDSYRYMMSYDDQIYNIVSAMDWTKLQEQLRAMHWTRFEKAEDSERYVFRTPSRRQLVSSAEELLWKVANTNEFGGGFYCISSGGFRVERHIDDGVAMLRISFELAQWDMDWESVTNEDYY